MKVIAIANQKGGIGKTTTALSLAAALREAGNKVLIIDSDSQCNSTDTYQAQFVDTATLYDVLIDKDDPLPMKDAIQHTEAGDIVAGDPALQSADVLLDPTDCRRLHSELTTLGGLYDFVVIDTPPINGVILRNVLAAADRVIIPVTADRFALQGLSLLNQTILHVKRTYNNSLKIAGLLLVRYHSRQTLTAEASEALCTIAQQMDTKVFDSKIRESIVIRKAQKNHVTTFPKRSAPAQDYKALLDELLNDWR